MFQGVTTGVEVAKLIDSVLPAGHGRDSFIRVSDLVTGNTYSIYRMQDSPEDRIVIKRSGDDVTTHNLEVHIAGKLVGGKLDQLQLTPRECAAEIKRWITEWDSITRPDVQLPQGLSKGMSIDERLEYRMKLGFEPISSLPDARSTLEAIVAEKGQYTARNADPGRGIYPPDRTYSVFQNEAGDIAVSFNFSHGPGDCMGADTVFVSRDGSVRHFTSPGESLTDPEKVLAKLNELLKEWISKKDHSLRRHI